MKQVYIGTWLLGWRNVDLYGREGDGAEFYFAPDKKSDARIKVGMNQTLVQSLRDLFHEAGEFLMTDRNHAHQLFGQCANDITNRLFVFRHHEWGEIAAHEADFITDCLDPFKKAWRTFNRKPVKPAPKPKRKRTK